MNKPWSQELWHVSAFNFTPQLRAEVTLARDIVISDGTLRDGEQQPGIVFSPEDKVRLAQALDEIGIPEIEVGMPSVSQQEQEAIKSVAKAWITSQN